MLLRLAALYDSDHPAAQVLFRLFRTVTWRESPTAAQMIAMAESMTFDGTVVITTRPISVPRAHPYQAPGMLRVASRWRAATLDPWHRCWWWALERGPAEEALALQLPIRPVLVVMNRPSQGVVQIAALL
ncbi:hypothetical protein [Actinoplanes sp. M2I2]|uniref:hypothetical protein n=1 Tax=Actinoplanes sp. M2I2 TaxID=1734444 RepID=UPI002020CF51|nr:hypothetical protein [Actinoplanes sp. M2I2]